MSQRLLLDSIPQATEELREIPRLYARLRDTIPQEKKKIHDKVTEAFHRVREYLDKLDQDAKRKNQPKAWELETDLKAAYLDAVAVLKHSFEAYIQARRLELDSAKESFFRGGRND